MYGSLRNIQSFLFPTTCVLCGAPTTGADSFCNGCRNSLTHPGPACVRCAAPLPGNSPSDLHCGNCQQKRPAFDRAIAVYRYTPPLDRLIQGGKYNGRLDWLDVLARELADRLHGIAGDADALIPVPLHRTKLRERGYNQSLELARPLARRLQLPVITGGVRRARPTVPQTGLSRELREKNVRRAFVVERNLEGQRLAIVDDVMTSGATIDALAKALRRAGAVRVEAWVLARAG